MGNTIFCIHPIKRRGTWVFDDPARGLLEEPFVAGIGESLDICVAAIDRAEGGFVMMSAAGRFPGYSATLLRQVRWSVVLAQAIPT